MSERVSGRRTNGKGRRSLDGKSECTKEAETTEMLELHAPLARSLARLAAAAAGKTHAQTNSLARRAAILGPGGTEAIWRLEEDFQN